MARRLNVVTRATVDHWERLTASANTPTYKNDAFQEVNSTAVELLDAGDAIKGGTPVEVAMMGAQLAIEHLKDRETADSFPRARFYKRCSAAARGMLDLLRPTSSLTAFSNLVAELDMRDLDDRHDMRDILTALACLDVASNPDENLAISQSGANSIPGIVYSDESDDGAPAWSPTPRKTAEYRRKLITYHHQLTTVTSIAMHIAEVSEQSGITDYTIADATQVARGVCEKEVDTLQEARLYYAGADTCAAAARKAGRGRKAPLSTGRLPSNKGLIVLEDAVPVWSGLMIAAASWHYAPGADRITLNLYTPADTPTGLEWWGWGYPEPGEVISDSKNRYPHRVVVALWDLITQERVGPRVVDTQTLERKKQKARSDARRGIQDRGDVRVVTIRGRVPAAPERRGDADSDGEKRRRYDRGRWMVSEHDRNQCKDPHRHADGECWHEDITIMEYPKGPAGAPFLDTVNHLKDRNR